VGSDNEASCNLHEKVKELEHDEESCRRRARSRAQGARIIVKSPCVLDM